MPKSIVRAIAVIAVASILIGAVNLVRPRPERPEFSFDVRPPASGEPTNGPTPGPAGAWAQLDLPDYELAADLTPTDVDASGVGLASAFAVRSRTSTPAVELAAGFVSTPAIAVAVESGVTLDTAVIRPLAPLEPGVRYRFQLIDPSGALAGSWLFQAEQPLHVVTTLPGDQATEVPVATGIEVTFDQDGVIGVSDHFRIEPAVSGRFEPHGRTFAFVPTGPLDPSSVYTVSVTRGVALAGSEQILEADVTFRFETAAPRGTAMTFQVELERWFVDVRPAFEPVVAVGLYAPDEGALPDQLPYAIYRLGSFDRALDAARTLAAAPWWADRSEIGLVPLDDLRRVAAGDARVGVLRGAWRTHAIRLPALDTGWYLLVLPLDGRDEQAVIQVTEVATYALTSDTRTLAWVNDTRTDAPITGARVAVAGQADLGTTGRDGLLMATTPPELLGSVADEPQAVRFLEVHAPDGRDAIVPLGLETRGNGSYPWNRNQLSNADSPQHRYWLALYTDRSEYRRSDVVNTWGVVRPRDDGALPGELAVVLRTGEQWADSGIVVLRVAVTPDARGTFVADLAIRDLPLGDYAVELRAGDEALARTGIRVADIRKPSYEIQVTPARLAVVEGDALDVTARVAFFDGTPAPGIDLRFEGFEQSLAATSGPDGVARVRFTATTQTVEGVDQASIHVGPERPEEADIGGGAAVLVVPSPWWLTGSATLTDGAISLTGRLTTADLEAAAEAIADERWPDDDDLSGSPVAGAAVSARVVQIVTDRRQVGTEYDPIEKVVTPIYAYTQRRVLVDTLEGRSASDGSIEFVVGIADASGAYEVQLRAIDGDQRPIVRTVWVEVPSERPETESYVPVNLGSLVYCGSGPVETASIGTRISSTIRDGDGPVASGRNDRFLFTVSSRGLREAVVRETGTFDRVFAATDLPSLSIGAVWFDGDGYRPAESTKLVRLALDDRRLDVRLETDRTRYAPGDDVTLVVRTFDPEGRPTPAAVVLRGTDQKLYAIGAAYEVDPLRDLFAPVGDGLLQSYASHVAPRPVWGDGCGDTVGGGRDDFRDSILFRRVTTDDDGIASLTIHLPDDLTSWRIEAAGVDDRFDVGQATMRIPVGLPFFVEAVLAPDYLVADRPILRVRAYGDSLRTGDRVRFTVSAPSLLMSPMTVEATAFETASVPLPPLVVGRHRIDIRGVGLGDPDALADRLIRTIDVVRTRLVAAARTYDPLTADWSAGDASGLTVITFSDAGRGRHIAALDELSWAASGRLDRLFAADLARSLLIEEFGRPPESIREIGLDLERYRRDAGLALLNYGSSDLELTARLLLIAPGRFDPIWARGALSNGVALQPTRERQIVVLAARAAIGESVLVELSAFDAESDLTVKEQAWLGLGFTAIGDDATARRIERDLLESHGERLGPWVRLAGLNPRATFEATSLMLLLASALGDPLAHDVARYLADDRPKDMVFALEQVGYASRMLARTPARPARFSWTLDGERHEVDLAAGEALTLTLTPAQLAGFAASPLEGDVLVSSASTVALAPADLPSSPLVRIERTIADADDLRSDRPVRVTLRVTLAAGAPAGCYQVVDEAPSGLMPLDPGSMGTGVTTFGVAPHVIEGRRVAWCVSPGQPATLTYLARAVSPGSYLWEPAVVQSEAAPEIGDATEAMTITIR